MRGVFCIDSNMRRTIIYKVTNGCNLACGYCYERRRLGEMKPCCTDSMADLLPFLEKEAESNSGNRYMICLHGGEPLLMGIPAFRKIAETLNRLDKNTDNSFAFSLQTNASLLTEEWAGAFFDYRHLMGERGVGVSLDGDSQTHDKYRKMIGGKGSYSSAVKGIRNLQNAGVPFGILSVTTNYSLENTQRIFDAIMALTPKFWRLLPCYNLNDDGSPLPYSVKPLSYAKYLREIFLLWVKSGLMKKIIVDPFATIISIIKKQPVPWCEYREDKCENFLSVETDGSLCICDTFPIMTYKDETKLHGCNFHAALTDMPDYYHALKHELDSYCQGQNCSARSVCKGGCYGMRWFFKEKNKELYDEYCLAKREIVSFIQRMVDKADKQ